MDSLDLLNRFERQPDGTWTCLVDATIETPAGTLAIPAGTVYAYGERHENLDVAEYLEQLGAQFGS